MNVRRLGREVLTTLPGATRPDYDPAHHGTGIVHLGIGAFHRAHQAAYTDTALAVSGGDWRITGISLRSADVADRLNPQNGLYTLLERDASGTRAKVIASIDRVLVAPTAPDSVLAALTSPHTRIVSLTVTEKAYGIAREGNHVISNHPSIAPDLVAPRAPQGAVGLLVEALRRRRAERFAPFTALCCDNLPGNGALLRGGVLDFARRLDADLADWIAEAVPFPSTMVDRITPAPTNAAEAEAAALTGFTDRAAIETEVFAQWVIEDRFAAGRPNWEAAGAVFVSDVAPYERMKLRMLNGSHSMLAYTGFLSGRRFVRDVMADPALARLVQRHLAAAADTLAPLPEIDLTDYAQALAVRFANPAIAHATRQIAMDGTEKLPQRLLAPAAEVLARGGDIRPFAFAIAAWMRYTLGRTDEGTPYALHDPRETELAIAAQGAGAEDIVQRLHAVPSLFPSVLSGSRQWRQSVVEVLATMLERGMESAIHEEASLV